MSNTQISDLKVGQKVKFGTHRNDATIIRIWPDCDIVQLQSDYRSLVCNVNQIYIDELEMAK
jgi:sRNA-binding protein